MSSATLTNKDIQVNKKGFIKTFAKWKYLYMMLIPGLLFILIFRYGPMFGLFIAFQDFRPARGVTGSDWVGFDNFRFLFGSQAFLQAFRNTVIISFYRILFGFPIPILLALLINEIGNRMYRRTVQTILFMPHFFSWAVMFGLVFALVQEFGPINNIIRLLGGDPVIFLASTRHFRGLLIVSDVWKDAGWNAVIFLAALAGVPQDLYEAAQVDGAGRVQCIFRISLPSIMPTICIMLLLRIGQILNTGFEQVLTMYNIAVFSVGDIIDTYVFRVGLLESRFGVAAAAGMFRSVIALGMVMTLNAIMKKVGQESLY